MHRRPERQFQVAPYRVIVHDHACLIGLDGQQQHLTLLIDDRQGEKSMTSMCARDVVGALRQIMPNIIRGLYHG